MADYQWNPLNRDINIMVTTSQGAIKKIPLIRKNIQYNGQSNDMLSEIHNVSVSETWTNPCD